jgi:hypothetical protein
MLNRLVTLLPTGAREALRTHAARMPADVPVRPPAPQSAILPHFDTRPAAMTPLLPPAAINDNPLQAVHEAVERDLRASGHLR